MDGDTDKKVAAEKKRFMTDPRCRIMMCSLIGASEGHTLTKATHVAIVEVDWVPTTQQQFEDRAYGRTNDPHGINSWYFVGENTVDEKMLQLLGYKEKVTDIINSGKTNSTRKRNVHIGRLIVKDLMGKTLTDDDLEEDDEAA
jgi:SNF2 family DNA or RNA helicase